MAVIYLHGLGGSTGVEVAYKSWSHQALEHVERPHGVESFNAARVSKHLSKKHQKRCCGYALMHHNKLNNPQR
eukprot:1000138-Amphidinium_carterae.1